MVKPGKEYLKKVKIPSCPIPSKTAKPPATTPAKVPALPFLKDKQHTVSTVIQTIPECPGMSRGIRIANLESAMIVPNIVTAIDSFRDKPQR